MAVTIKIKNSAVPGNIPLDNQLVMGELGLNSADKKLFYRTPSGAIDDLLHIPDATETTSGLMSAEDKAKLDAGGGGGTPTLKTVNGETLLGTGNVVTATVLDLEGKANLVHTHIATQVSETAERIWMAPTDRSQIAANVAELESHSARIQALENGGGGDVSDGKVQMTIDSQPGYLADLVDGETVVNFGGKLSVVSISGLTATLEEINQLQGVTGNIQAQIDALTSIGNFKGTVETYADLSTVVDPSANDMVIVLNDETHNDVPAIYLYTGATWVYSGEFAAGQIRNFTTNPIQLATETTGVLQKSKMERFNAAEVNLVNSGNIFTGTTVEDALTELFTYANNIKKQVAGAVGYPLSGSDTVEQLVFKIDTLKAELAAAISSKGVVAYSYNTLGEMALKIQQIASVVLEGHLKKTNLTTVTAPNQLSVVLEAAIGIKDVCAQLMEFLPGAQNVTHFEKQFTNANGYEATGMTFSDGKMFIQTIFEYPMTLESTGSDWAQFGVTIDKDPLEITV